jgi:SAM-dependent methyltransferase
MEREWFSDWFGTVYYKMLYGHRNNAEAKPLVDAILGYCNPRANAKVWDMACGRGRHLHWFEKAGLSVFGTDLSEESILEAKSNLLNGILRVHDMRDPAPFHEMDITVNLFTSIGYFATVEEDERTISRAFESLAAGGYFILDFLHADKLMSQLVPENEQEVGEVRFYITRHVTDGRIVKEIEVHDAGIVHRFVEQVRAYTPTMLQQMLEEQGFSSVRLFGSDMTSDMENSDRCVVTGIKQ